MTPRLRTLTGATVLLVALAGATVWGDYRDAYLRGYQAVERRQWKEAEQSLRAALAKQPREGKRIRLTGNFVRDYLPHYYLGVALFHQGLLYEARQAWEESSRQGVAQTTPEGKQMATYLSRPEVIAARAPAEERSSDVPVSPNVARGEAAEATARDATRLVDGSDRDSSNSPASEVAAAVRAPLAIPTALRAAAHAHFSARYPDAIALLGSASYSEARLQAQAHLFRAAARFALYALDGERDASLRQLATDDVLACRTVAPGLRPDADAFSPRFVRFFHAAQSGTQ